VIYVYAIAEARPGLPADVAGFGGAPLRALEQGDLAAVYSSDPPAGLEPTREALWLHEGVLERLMATHAVLPLRFGSTLPSEHELRELLTARHREFAAALAVVRGRVEIGVRASATGPAKGGEAVAGESTSGHAYLAAKLERRRAAARMGEELHSELAALARASSFRLIADPRPAFAGAYLVDRERVGEFRRGFEAARDARPDLALACTGPWPPFSFTEALEGP
jgi:hypothetical protein